MAGRCQGLPNAAFLHYGSGLDRAVGGMPVINRCEKARNRLPPRREDECIDC